MASGARTASIDEERNLQLDRPGKGKTAEQLKKHSIDSGVENRPIDRALYILSMGDDVQKISIIQSLPSLVAQDSSATFTRVVPKIQQDLKTSSSEFQIAASGAFKTLLCKSGNASILSTIIKEVDSRDPNVAVAWAEALSDGIPSMSEGTIQSTILPFVKAKSSPNEPVPSRIFSCKLIGTISKCPKLRLINVKNDILPIVTSLCQDVSPDVRAAIGNQLAKVAGAIADVKSTNLLSSLVELAHDDNQTVRASAIEAISEMMSILNNEVKKQTILPLFMNLCDRAIAHSDITSVNLSSEIGTIIVGLESVINQEELLFFINIFKQLSLKGKISNQQKKMDASKEVICRERCAANIVGILRVAIIIAADQSNNVYAIFKDLAVDPCYLVRRAAASALAKIAQLSVSTHKIMKNEIVRLLRDDAVEVLDLLVPDISIIFLCLYHSQTLTYRESTQATVEIGKALLKCHTELSKGYNWRLTTTFLAQLECLPMCMPSEYIHNNFTPMLLDKVVNGKVKPIRIQSVHVLVVFMRYNFNPNQTKFIRDSLIKQTAQSRSCNSRTLYINVCEAVLEIFSEKFFKEFFLGPLLALATDKVATVRWKFASFIGKLKNMVTINITDHKTKQLILDTISKLEAKEKDRSVVEMLKLRRKDPPFKFAQILSEIEEKKIKDESTQVIKLPPALENQQPKFFQPPHKGQAPVRLDISEKYFFIDAGIALSSIANVETNPIANLTDDVKLNIIKMKCTSDSKLKRHSSNLTSDCLNESKKLHNRRSLHLPKDSKIPIFILNRSVKTKMPSHECSATDSSRGGLEGATLSRLSENSRSNINIKAGSSKSSVQRASKVNIQLTKSPVPPSSRASSASIKSNVRRNAPTSA